MAKYFATLIVVLYILLTTTAVAKIREFETTRLQSTSGAGVGTILVNEAATLNPAPIVFVPVSSFYYQNGTSKLDSISNGRDNNFGNGSSQMYLLSDSTTRLKGTFSYQDHSENHTRRKRFTSSVANNMGKRTAFGVLYRYTIDKTANNETKYHQGVFGFTHIYSPDLIIGGVLIDPFLASKQDSRSILGFQYSLTDNFFLIVDAGVNMHDKPKEKTISRAALQVNLLKDIYLRTGKFHDNVTNLKGNSWGISWIGPKLSIEYSYKMSEIISDNSDYLYDDEQIIETSLAFALVF